MITFLSRSEWYQYSFLVRTCLLSGNPRENNEKNVSEIYRRPYKSLSAKLQRVTHIHSKLKLIDHTAPLIRLLWSLFFLSLNDNQAMISKFDFRIHVIVIQILTSNKNFSTLISIRSFLLWGNHGVYVYRNYYYTKAKWVKEITQWKWLSFIYLKVFSLFQNK